MIRGSVYFSEQPSESYIPLNRIKEFSQKEDRVRSKFHAGSTLEFHSEQLFIIFLNHQQTELSSICQLTESR